ncbi:MAG: hypothetical protein ACRETC_09685 [Gammaproteobacteria bacterium]
MKTAGIPKYHHRIHPIDRCRRWSRFVAGTAALFASVAAWAGPAVPEPVVARTSGQLITPSARSTTPVTVSVNSHSVDLPIGFDQQPLDDRALSQYRGAGENSVAPDTRSHVAVILWDERGSGGQGGGPVKSGSTGYGNTQATSVVAVRVR